MEMPFERNYWQPNEKFTRNWNAFSSGFGLFLNQDVVILSQKLWHLNNEALKDRDIDGSQTRTTKTRFR